MMVFNFFWTALESKLVNQFCEDEHGTLIYNRNGNVASISGPSFHSVSSSPSYYMLQNNNINGQALSAQTPGVSTTVSPLGLGDLSQPLVLVWKFSMFYEWRFSIYFLLCCLMQYLTFFLFSTGNRPCRINRSFNLLCSVLAVLNKSSRFTCMQRSAAHSLVLILSSIQQA